MNLQQARKATLDAFDKNTLVYYHSKPYQYSNFIDGMAWVGILCGAAYKEGDLELARMAERYLNRLLLIGPNARNFAPEKVDDSWKESPTIDGYWYKEKPQSFAGPVGVYFAKKMGANIDIPESSKLPDPHGTARLFTLIAPIFGHLVYYIPWLRQHVNSMFLAHLLLDKKPPESMEYLSKENPFFSYMFAIPCVVSYPEVSRYSQGRTVTQSNIVPLRDRKPSSWVFRNWPYDLYIKEGEVLPIEYTPIWMVVGEYLQNTLRS